MLSTGSLIRQRSDATHTHTQTHNSAAKREPVGLERVSPRRIKNTDQLALFQEREREVDCAMWKLKFPRKYPVPRENKLHLQLLHKSLLPHVSVYEMLKDMSPKNSNCPHKVPTNCFAALNWALELMQQQQQPGGSWG